MAEKAKKIYEEFIQTEAPKEVSGHRAGDSAGREEAAAQVASSRRRAVAAQHPVPRLRGSHPLQPWCLCSQLSISPQPLLGSLLPQAPPADACPPLPTEGLP